MISPSAMLWLTVHSVFYRRRKNFAIVGAVSEYGNIYREKQ